MEEMLERRLVLSPVELHLLLQAMGIAFWNDVPLEKETTALEKELLDGFLRLTDAGCIVPSGTGRYRLTEEVRRLLLPLAKPDRKIGMLLRSEAEILYEKDGAQRLLRVNGDGTSCTLSEPEDGIAALCSCLQFSDASEGITVSEPPTEPFSAERDPAEIMEESEALFCISVPGQTARRCARVFFSAMVPWFSVLEDKEFGPVRFEERLLRRWLNQKEEAV